MTPPLILASQSPQRKELLAHLQVPFTTCPADVDETPLKNEAPRAYVTRIARAKASAVAATHPGAVVLAADTPVIVGRHILQKPQTEDEALAMLARQSGRRVHIPTVVVVVNAQGQLKHRCVESWVKLKHLTEQDKAAWLATGAWQGRSGALQLEGPVCSAFFQTVHGSVSGIIGLPLYETAQLLAWAGMLKQR